MTGVLTTNDANLAQTFNLLTRNQGSKLQTEVMSVEQLLAAGDPVLTGIPLYDDFQSATPITNPGAGTQVRGGIGDTNCTLVTVGISAGTPWLASPVAASAGAIGVGRMQTGGNGTITSVCRGLSPTDLTVCRVRDIFRLDFILNLDAQDSTTSGLFHYFGLNGDWAALTNVMGLQRQIGVGDNWILRRSGVALLDTGVRALSADGPWFVRFQQRQDQAPAAGELGLGTGRWDLFIASPSSPSIATPVVADFDGGAVGGVPATSTNYGLQVQKFSAAGVQTSIDVDLMGFQPFPKTLAQRIAA